jgi:hypothetical protein
MPPSHSEGVLVLFLGSQGSKMASSFNVFGARPMCGVPEAAQCRTPTLEPPIEFRLFAKAVLGSVIGRTHIRLSPATWAEPPGRPFLGRKFVGLGQAIGWLFCFSCARLRVIVIGYIAQAHAGCNLNMPLSGPLKP